MKSQTLVKIGPRAARCASGNAPIIDEAVADLHSKCGIYTHPAAVGWFLDKIGWTENVDLSEAHLLEPAAGDGAFLIEVTRRLCRAFRAHGRRRSFNALAPRVLAFEIHPVEAEKARRRVARVLRGEGLSKVSAEDLSSAWVRTADFLLADMGGRDFTHVVGNPPYVRWSRVPTKLKKTYEEALPPRAARGDLSLAFLDRALSALSTSGRLGFLCSDRWLYSAYAEAFRTEILPGYVIEHRSAAVDDRVFAARVDAYPVQLVMRRKVNGRRSTSRAMTGSNTRSARRIYEKWLKEYSTLEEAGCIIRVGPALGPERAFVGKVEDLDVEPELLAAYIGPSELTPDGIAWRERLVICMHDDDGQLRDLHAYPRLARHLKVHEIALTDRAMVRGGAPWYRPIDRVRSVDWSRPKLLVPEMAKEPRIVLDRDGFVPSHGVYAIFPPNDEIDPVYQALANGVLRTSLMAIAPRAKGGSIRCYKKFLSKVPMYERQR